jgi:hypothetical protein
MPLRLPSPADGTLLCAEHAIQLGTTAMGAVADMRTSAASRTNLHGRRLQDGEAHVVIRGWPLANGYPVSTQRSIAAPIIAAYRQATLEPAQLKPTRRQDNGPVTGGCT